MCALLDISKPTLYRIFKSEKLQPRKMGGSTVVLRDEAIEYLRTLPRLKLSKIPVEASGDETEEDV